MRVWFSAYDDMFGTRRNDFCLRDLVIVEWGVREYKVYWRFWMLKNRCPFVTKEASRTKPPPSDTWEGGNCILIPASPQLGVGVTMTRSKTQIPGNFFSNFYKADFSIFSKI